MTFCLFFYFYSKDKKVNTKSKNAGKPRAFLFYNQKEVHNMTTQHSIKRARERTGLNTEASKRLISRAVKHGIEPKCFPARERKHLLQIQRDQSRVLVYNFFIYILNKNSHCITMYRVPDWFGKKNYDGKTKIRNIKKYLRHNELYEGDNDTSHPAA